MKQLYALRKRTGPVLVRQGSCGTQAQELETRRDTVDELPFLANTRDPMNAIKKANCSYKTTPNPLFPQSTSQHIVFLVARAARHAPVGGGGVGRRRELSILLNAA